MMPRRFILLNRRKKHLEIYKIKKLLLLGVAYRFNSEDTRNSPTLVLANYLRDNNVEYIMHDPYVKEDDQNVLKFKQEDHLTHDLNKALEFADYVFICSAHKEYIDHFDTITFSRKYKRNNGCIQYLQQATVFSNNA